jgi:glycosyltransferase involved in cell wall biosynthesis
VGAPIHTDAKPKVAFVEIGDPDDPRWFSGTTSRILEAFRELADVTTIGPLNSSLKFLFAGQKIYHRMRGQKFFVDREPLLLRSYGRQIVRRLPAETSAIFSTSSIPISALPAGIPAFYWADAVLPSLPGYFDDLDSFSPATLRAGELQEKAAIRRASLAFYASEWAAEAARKLKPELAEKIKVVSFGANTDPSLTAEEARSLIEERSLDTCRLLFVGVDTERKGLSIAIAVANILNASGIKTTLSIVGSEAPVGETLPDHIRFLGFIPRESPHLRELFETSNFFILPTRAECFGVVFCEAAAFGLPIIATRTGGVPTAVADGEMGLLFDLEAGPDVYADAIASILRNPARYREMAWSAFNHYRARLNWRTQAKFVIDSISRQISVA